MLFGSIILYSVANIVNGFVQTTNQYALVRFIAGVGLAGELGAGDERESGRKSGAGAGPAPGRVVVGDGQHVESGRVGGRYQFGRGIGAIGWRSAGRKPKPIPTRIITPVANPKTGQSIRAA